MGAGIEDVTVEGGGVVVWNGEERGREGEGLQLQEGGLVIVLKYPVNVLTNFSI